MQAATLAEVSLSRTYAQLQADMGQGSCVEDGVPRDLLWVVICLQVCVGGGAVQAVAVALEIVHHLNLAKQTGQDISTEPRTQL